ncbi:hypothetical protein C8Q74DRAFT_1436587 [Fomes fomentarius]|nr:hypothetical protein C8Q74DRAFT_1436587 [Fomes fomentarius]
MSSDSDTSAYITAVEHAFQQKLIIIAGTGLMFYDWIINIQKDISLVWRYKRVTLLKVLYIATRYLWLVVGVLDIATMIPVDNQYNSYFWQKRLFASLRTYALTSRNVLLTSIVSILALGTILPNLYAATREWVVINEPLLGCGYTDNLDPTTMRLLIYVSRGAMIASEAIVCIITWKTTYKCSRAASAMVVGECVSLPEILLRNGIQCFIVPVLLTTTTLVLEASSSGNRITVEGSVAKVRDVLTTVLISRFLLDLLQAGARSNADYTSGPTPSDGLFTTQVTHEAPLGDTDSPPQTSEGTVTQLV